MVTSVTDASITVTWDPPTILGSGNNPYYWQRFKESSTNSWITDGTIARGLVTHTFVALTAGTSYDVEVYACLNSDTTDCGQGAQISNIMTTGGDPPPTNTPATGKPLISGTAQVGETLTAGTDHTGTDQIADDDGLTNPTYTYQWNRRDTMSGADVEITGATSGTYTLVQADLGKFITVTVSFQDDGGNEEELTSDPTAAVAAIGEPLLALSPTRVSEGDGRVSIRATVYLGQQLTNRWGTLYAVGAG